MKRDMYHALSSFGALACALTFPLVCAAEYPDKPVRVIVAQPAGGNADLVSRSFAQRLTDHFGVQFVVDNRGGGGGIIGTELAIHAVPDGYTLLIVPTALGTNPA